MKDQYAFVLIKKYEVVRINAKDIPTYEPPAGFGVVKVIK